MYIVKKDTDIFRTQTYFLTRQIFNEKELISLINSDNKYIMNTYYIADRFSKFL